MRIFKLIFSLWLFITILVPSGTILNYPIKTIVTLILLIFFTVLILLKQIKFYEFNIYFTVYIFSILILVFWVFVSTVNGFSFKDAFKEYLYMFYYVMVYIIFFQILKNKIFNSQFLKNYIISLTAIYALIKIFVEGLIFLKIVTISELLTSYRILFNLKLSSIRLIPGNLWRLNNAADIILFVITSDFLIDLFIYRKFNKKNCILLIFLIAAVYVSSSRLAFIMVALSFLLGYLLTTPYKKIVTVLLLLFLIALSFIRPIQYYNNIIYRFKSYQTEISNEIKLEQAKLFIKQVERNPIWGLGLGSFIKSDIRDSRHNYSYEVYLLSLWFKLGTLGFLIFLTGNLFVYLYLYSLYIKFFLDLKQFLKVSFLFFMFWMSVSVNLYFTGIVCAITYTYIFLLSWNNRGCNENIISDPY